MSVESIQTPAPTRTNRAAPAVVIALLVALVAGTAWVVTHRGEEAAGPGSPVQLTAIEGTSLKQVTLTEEAVTRLDLATKPVALAEVSVAGVTGSHKVIPYSAVVYDTDGSTWTYVVKAERSYLRAPVTVVGVDGDRAVLTDGPADGTDVVVTGAPELLGAEYEISGEQ